VRCCETKYETQPARTSATANAPGL
jgi:hypothetical protein